MTIRTARLIVYTAAALAPALPLTWLTVAIITDMLSEEPPVVRWASEMEPLELADARKDASLPTTPETE